MEIDERTLERIEEAVDWLSQPIRISIDKRGEIHVAFYVSIGNPAHYEDRCTSKQKDPDPVAEFVRDLVPCATSALITFKEPNVVDEIRVEHRNECLVIHNMKGHPDLDICTLMEALRVNRSTASRTFSRIAKGKERQIQLIRPRHKWMLSQRV